MIFLWIMFLTGLIAIPSFGLLVLRWAIRNGEFRNLDKIALSIFNEEEPVGEMTDHFPVAKRKTGMPRVSGRGGIPPKTPAIVDGLTDDDRSASRIQSSNSDGKFN